jgi:(E)-4-hydroxy-3-methylbut-2-enyl-diphosphate synthase
MQTCYSAFMSNTTLPVKTGNIIIGGGFPVTVQTMWKKPLSQPDEQLKSELDQYGKIGCDIIRFAVPKLDDAEIVGAIAARSAIPIVCDIHFDYRIALRCMDFPIAKIRINPGTIGAEWKVKEIVAKALDRKIAIRVGINGGSLPSSLEHEPDVAEAMVKAAEEELDLLTKLGFSQIVFSLKSQDVFITIRANEIFSSRHKYPLHLGVTEAGPLINGVMKNRVALSTLLSKGIGDTIRISLSDSSQNEIISGKLLLGILGLRKKGLGIVSCPMCSRSAFNVGEFVKRLGERLPVTGKEMTIAVMGCPVNGPGEAKNANLGITGAGKYAVIFKEGKIIRKVPLDDALAEFIGEIEKL